MTPSIKGISHEIFSYMVAGGVGWSPMRAKKKKMTLGKKFISGSPLGDFALASSQDTPESSARSLEASFTRHP